ncbi:MAG: hypothetical protein Q9219_001914 [cf. Caloplaca sp. 3 TL-2023]
MQRSSRLKPALIDSLDNVGLVSKGDPSLLNYETQEDYFEIIKCRYRAFILTSKAEEGDLNDLGTGLTSMSLDQGGREQSIEWVEKEDQVTASTPSTSPKISKIIMALRKLREGIVAACRTDDFAKMVYLFTIRTTILLRHPESYHPALLHMFRYLYSFAFLKPIEKKEFVGYYILDLACRQHDLATAFRIRSFYDYRHALTDAVLTALVQSNWILFSKVEKEANAYERRLISWANEKLIGNTLRCLGKSYWSISRAYIERCTGTTWEDLKKSEEVPWALDGETVVIRQMRKK